MTNQYYGNVRKRGISYSISPRASRVEQLMYDEKLNELYRKDYIYDNSNMYLIISRPKPEKYNLVKINDDNFKNKIINLIKNYDPSYVYKLITFLN